MFCEAQLYLDQKRLQMAIYDYTQNIYAEKRININRAALENKM